MKVYLSFNIIFLFLLFFSGKPPQKFICGDCIESSEVYLKRIASTGQPGYDVECLYAGVNYISMGYEYFASPGAIKKIKDENESTKALAYEVLPQFLHSSNKKDRCSVAKALAWYGWPESYDYLIACKCDDPILFAILGNKKAIPGIIKKYKAIEKKYISKSQFGYPEKMDCLNALYHLASLESLTFINSVITNPKPEKIKTRAIKVRDRIKELYPD